MDWVLWLFVFSTLFTFAYFTKSIQDAKMRSIFIWGALAWLVLQSLIAASGFYLNFETMPPRFVLVLLPPLLLTAWLHIFKWEKIRGEISLEDMTYLSIVRIPIEIVLWQWFVQGLFPEILTFEGRNFDIFAGITAPVVAYLVFTKKVLNARHLLWWNIISLVLLLNIVFHAILSVPTPFQMFAFDRPNTIVVTFPYVWLPALIVNTVLFCHITSIRKLWGGRG